MAALRVFAVDDHPLFRLGLCAMLAREPDLEVVGEAEAGLPAIDAVTGAKPDVVVMDLHLPDITGIEATAQIVAACPGTGVLVLTMFEDSDSLFAAMRAGARGYLLKGSSPEEILGAVRAIGRGQAVFGPSVAGQLLAYFSGRRAVFPGLTDREREVLALVADGYGNATIARTLSVAPKTVRNHVSSIFAKLHVANRAEAIVQARRAGLGSQPTPGG
ncbi:MAG TPA: response regulator transcription factor [Pseudonocardiaceae bacterium]|jgi:DNA-binding NarL/FixJ family response regulator|nr:response regulator transcription factor [Pseudonocardiaceae bacterium]